MKFKIIFILLVSIFLNGCTIDLSGKTKAEINKKDNEIKNLTHQIETNKISDDLFTKRQECGKYKDSIEKKFKEEEEERLNAGFIYSGEIKKIDYSNKYNSCIYVSVQGSGILNINNGNFTTLSNYIKVTDAITGSDIERIDLMYLDNNEVRNLIDSTIYSTFYSEF